MTKVIKVAVGTIIGCVSYKIGCTIGEEIVKHINDSAIQQYINGYTKGFRDGINSTKIAGPDIAEKSIEMTESLLR